GDVRGETEHGEKPDEERDVKGAVDVERARFDPLDRREGDITGERNPDLEAVGPVVDPVAVEVLRARAVDRGVVALLELDHPSPPQNDVDIAVAGGVELIGP